MTNSQIAQSLGTIASLLNLKGENPFKIRAYQRAAETIENMSEDIAGIAAKGEKALQEIPGIGIDLSLKIVELVTTGKLVYLDELKKEVPAGLLQITDIQGMGPKKTAFVWKTFKVENVDDLEKLAKSGKLDTQKGWGEKSVKNILEGIEALRAHSGRVAITVALPVAEQLKQLMQESGLCGQVEIAGSLRRRRETIGDIDILVTSDKPEKVMDVFCGYELVERVLGKGPTKSSVYLKTGINADLRVVEEDAFGAALHYFTGSKDHNVHVRRLANAQGYTVNEYGVHEGTAEKKGKLRASKTEEEIYKLIGLPFIPPELREDRGEVQAAQEGKLPELITREDLKGDLHMHSTFSDGSSTMIEMARAAKELGHAYIAITDHASPMGMVRGIKEGNIDDYLALVEEARKAVKGIHILAGAEVDIMEDGSLYLPDAVLKKLDWVVASVHGHFNMPVPEMTARVLRAMEHPLVNVFAHPTSRLLLKRDPIEYDVDAVFKAAAKNDVAIEINASHGRLDVNDVLARRAKETGCTIVIDSDAHRTGELDYRFGITQARRAWLEKKDVLNTMPFKKVQEWGIN